MKNQSSTPSPANYGSNNERLKKAMLQRNKPAQQQQPVGHSTNSIVLNHQNQGLDYHNHHMSVSNFTTYSSSSSSSSFSSSEFTTDSMSSCGSYSLQGKFAPSLETCSSLGSQYSSSQQTLNSNTLNLTSSNKYNIQLDSVSNSHSVMSPMSYDYTTSSTGSGHTTNNSNKFGRLVANSMLSLSSVDSQEQHRPTTTKRLFESSLQTNVPDLEAPVFIVPTKCSRVVEEDPSATTLPLLGVTDDQTGNLTQISLQSSLQSLDIDEYYTSFSSSNHSNLSSNALRSQSSLLRLHQIADSTRENKASISQYNTRRNSVSSVSSSSYSSQNSFLNNPSLDLDSVIRSALVETSHTVHIKKQLAAAATAEYTSIPTANTTLNAGSNEYRNEFSLPLTSSNLASQMNDLRLDGNYQKQQLLNADQQELLQQQQQQKKGISRIGNSVMKLARKMKN
ncbi:hypothetical protein D0Z00_002006 [Geotrichum galactomycetum]|uniref:Uncharacterized protein n=1 Tax=Geotrichum galactomycetum TaxID=27317 RepID=A0ACB6V5E1_9ASCO|nr:hypothetical protein D0Z00_002006 [Geotrichum candidum]